MSRGFLIGFAAAMFGFCTTSCVRLLAGFADREPGCVAWAAIAAACLSDFWRLELFALLSQRGRR